MPVKSTGTATISFGLVSVPVHIYSSAESRSNVSFNMLHKKCGSRLKQQYLCTKDGEVVTRDDTVKGYEFAKDQYVILTPEELKALDEKATGAIDIIEFVPLNKVERVYLEKVYYLGPDKGGDRAYRLLAKALEETGLAALGQYAARGTQYLVLLRPANDGVLVMEQLHYADEIRPTTEVTVPAGDIKPMELTMAKQLIAQTASETFDPEKYRDTVRERVMEAIQKKVDGQEITSDAKAEGGGKILDLMEALKASLASPAAEEEEPKKKSGRKAS
jgi:DNA end-binding protein Ku